MMTSILFNKKLTNEKMNSKLKLLEIFIEEFFDQNPICQLGIIVMKDKRAEKLSELSGSARKHVRSLKEMNVTQGEPSLQNGLDLARQSLKMLPSHASREIVVIMSSLTTCDPTDILVTIDNLKKDGIRCSVVSLSAEIHVCRYLTEQTNGRWPNAGKNDDEEIIKYFQLIFEFFTLNLRLIRRCLGWCTLP